MVMMIKLLSDITYIAFQDSKLGNVNQNEKDSEEYFKIRYYLIGEEKERGAYH